MAIKINLGLSLMLLFTSFLYSFQKREKQSRVCKIHIIKAEDYVFTPVNINCQEFEKWDLKLSSEDRTDLKEIRSIQKMIEEAKPCKECAIDVRAKMVLFYSNMKTDTVCMGTTTIIWYKNSLRELKDRELFKLLNFYEE